MSGIHAAASNMDVGPFKAFLVGASDVDERDDEGNTALHIAAYSNKIDNMVALLESGANVNARNNLGWTAFHLAATNQDDEACRILHSHGGDPYLLNDDGWKPLDFIVNADLRAEFEAAEPPRGAATSIDSLGESGRASGLLDDDGGLSPAFLTQMSEIMSAVDSRTPIDESKRGGGAAARAAAAAAAAAGSRERADSGGSAGKRAETWSKAKERTSPIRPGTKVQRPTSAAVGGLRGGARGGSGGGATASPGRGGVEEDRAESPYVSRGGRREAGADASGGGRGGGGGGNGGGGVNDSVAVAAGAAEREFGEGVFDSPMDLTKMRRTYYPDANTSVDAGGGGGGGGGAGGYDDDDDLDYPDYMSANPSDPDLLKLAGEFDKWSVLLKRSILSDFTDAKAAMIARHKDALVREHRRHKAQMREQEEEMQRMKDFVSDFEQTVDNRDSEIQELKQALADKDAEIRGIYAQHERDLAAQHAEHVIIASRMARKMREHRTLRKCIQRWRRKTETGKHKVVDELLQEKVDAASNAIAEEYEEKFAVAAREVEEARAALNTAYADRDAYETAMKQRFMRALCAVTSEAGDMWRTDFPLPDAFMASLGGMAGGMGGGMGGFGGGGGMSGAMGGGGGGEYDAPRNNPPQPSPYTGHQPQQPSQQQQQQSQQSQSQSAFQDPRASYREPAPRTPAQQQQQQRTSNWQPPAQRTALPGQAGGLPQTAVVRGGAGPKVSGGGFVPSRNGGRVVVKTTANTPSGSTFQASSRPASGRILVERHQGTSGRGIAGRPAR